MSERVERQGIEHAKPIVSEWIQITQEMINQFGITTLDQDPMHMDPQWAIQNSPFNATIAYGFLTLSLLTRMFHDACKNHPEASYLEANFVHLNYGLDKVRLVSPVPVLSRIRGHFSVLDKSERTRSGRTITRLACRVEIEGQDSPALSGEWLSVGLPAPGQLDVEPEHG